MRLTHRIVLMTGPFGNRCLRIVINNQLLTILMSMVSGLEGLTGTTNQVDIQVGATMVIARVSHGRLMVLVVVIGPRLLSLNLHNNWYLNGTVASRGMLTN